MQILIPMAGDGKRFSAAGYSMPKPLIDINGKPMIQAAIESLGLVGQYIFIIRDYPGFTDKIIETLCKIAKNPIIKCIDYLTDGAARTCLLAEKHIDNEDPLIITNCDQIMEWNPKLFTKFIDHPNFDGAVVTYKKQTVKNSYVRLENGIAVEFAEKKIISDQSLNGIHYWRKGSDFVRSAKAMIEKKISVNNEYYIAPTYNELVKEGKKIVAYEIPISEHFAVGTPEDLGAYLEYEKWKYQNSQK